GLDGRQLAGLGAAQARRGRGAVRTGDVVSDHGRVSFVRKSARSSGRRGRLLPPAAHLSSPFSDTNRPAARGKKEERCPAGKHRRDSRPLPSGRPARPGRRGMATASPATPPAREAQKPTPAGAKPPPAPSHPAA